MNSNRSISPNKSGIVSVDEIVRNQRPDGRPHVVILGAGASRAACPNGDRIGRTLPVMKDLVKSLGLEDLLGVEENDSERDFEAIYSELHSRDPQDPLLRKLERSITEYFERLKLPETPTLYDLLLLSLRDKDAILTFNWDPFLADAFERNSGAATLPHILHLHGNVRVGFCGACVHADLNGRCCRGCGKVLEPTRLLYPIKDKDYESDPFIKKQWESARKFVEHALIVTIFGYSAPKSDRAAMDILRTAWKDKARYKLLKHVEIIDVRDSEEVSRQWSPFSFYLHRDVLRSVQESSLFHYPRRSCEALIQRGIHGNVVEKIPWAGNLKGVRESIEALTTYE